jgi:hypothetical protein
MRRWSIAAAALTCLVAMEPSLGADLCFRQGRPDQRIDRADIIFAGRVLAAELVRETPPSRVRVTFQVERLYRGHANGQIEATFQEEYFAPFTYEPFRTGRHYPHVFVRTSEEGLIGDLCATAASLERRSCKERIESIPSPAVRERMKEPDFVCVLEMRGLR